MKKIHSRYLGVIFVLILSIVMLWNKSKCDSGTEDIFYKKVLKGKDEEIDSLNRKLSKVKIALAEQPKVIIKIKKEYVPVFKEISSSTISELESAFDSLVTE